MRLLSVTLASRTKKMKLTALIVALCVASANALNIIIYENMVCAAPSVLSSVQSYSGGDGNVANLAQMMATETTSDGTSVYYYTLQIECPGDGDVVTVQGRRCADASYGSCAALWTQVYTRENWKKAAGGETGCYVVAHTEAGVTRTVSGTSSGEAPTQLNCLQEDGAAATRISVMAAAVAFVSAVALL